MKVDLFDFELPEGRIALRPAKPRHASRLLCVNVDGTEDLTMMDLPDLLDPQDLLVFNNTKVLPSRLQGTRRALDQKSDVPIEVTLHKGESNGRWRSFARPARKIREGDWLDFAGNLKAHVDAKGERGEILLDFRLSRSELFTKLHEVGILPLPPYIAGKRDVDARDALDYQTVFASKEGAVAAPTAGLHFSDQLLKVLREHGIGTETVTLHVGAGTFLPVFVDDTDDHKMHAEVGAMSAETAAAINEARASGGRIIAVGTTVLRLLESATSDDGVVEAFDGETDIFIEPGYRFRAVDMLLTNFHLPKSTLFMLVSAFSGLTRMQAAYAHAIKEGYRFYSYGDACLLTRCDDV